MKFYAEYTDDCRKDVKIKSKHQLLAFLAHTKTYINEVRLSGRPSSRMKNGWINNLSPLLTASRRDALGLSRAVRDAGG